MDSRFRLKVQFEIYGLSRTWDCSLNWTAEPGEIDHRITDWFLSVHDAGYADYLDRIEQYRKERDADLIRQTELAELRRLQSKYPDAV